MPYLCGVVAFRKRLSQYITERSICDMTKKKVIVCSVILGVILIGLLACEVMYPTGGQAMIKNLMG